MTKIKTLSIGTMYEYDTPPVFEGEDAVAQAVKWCHDECVAPADLTRAMYIPDLGPDRASSWIDCLGFVRSALRQHLKDSRGKK